MRALSIALPIALLMLPAGCKKGTDGDSPGSSAGAAASLESAGTMGGNDLADAWEADGANRAKVKDKFFGKRWTIDLCENLSLETDHVAIRVHSNRRWVTTKIYFRDPKEIATIDWIGSNKKVRVNALCKDEFTFTDAVIVPKTPEELKTIQQEKKSAKVAEAQRKLSQKKQELVSLQGQLDSVNSGKYKYDKESEKKTIINGIKFNISTCESQIRALEEELRKIEAE